MQSNKVKDKNIGFEVDFLRITDDQHSSIFSHSPVIHCDEKRIMQVLINLQSNAIKFTQRGEIRTTVEIITNNEHQKFLKISVIDTGIGIPKKDHNKLFKLFGFLKDNQKMNINGIGLGLMISQQIVEQFDGKISFQSEEGVGSCFEFTFKLQSGNDNNESDEVDTLIISQRDRFAESHGLSLGIQKLENISNNILDQI